MRKLDLSIELVHPLEKVVLQSLLPEVECSAPRTQINISETNVGVLLSIEAENTNALRAALNSYLRWLNCIISISSSILAEDSKSANNFKNI